MLPNDSELAALGGLDPVLAVVGAVVVTHGRHGASWYSPTERVNVPAPESHETDSTGAGDAFNAGLLSALAGRRGPLAALRPASGPGPQQPATSAPGRGSSAARGLCVRPLS